MTNLLKASDRGNCEPDADALLAVATAIASRPNRPVCEAKVSFKPDSGVVPPFEMDYATENCSQCTAALYSTNRPVRRSRETLLGLKGYTGLRSTDIGSLKAPSELFFAVVAAAYEVTETQVCSALGNHGVQQKLLLCVCDTDAYKALLIQLCSSNRLSQMMARFVRMQLHLTCARVSAQAGGKGVNRLNRKHLKVSSRACPTLCWIHVYPATLPCSDCLVCGCSAVCRASDRFVCCVACFYRFLVCADV